MYTNILAGIIISVILALLFIISYIPFKILPRDVLILLFIILQIISIFFLFYTPYEEDDGSEKASSENFYFEVSPQRQKCLREQVSLRTKPGYRSKDCCPSYTVGGKLPTIQEWENSESPINWDRTDNNTTSEGNNAFSTQLAPTALHTLQKI